MKSLKKWLCIEVTLPWWAFPVIGYFGAWLGDAIGQWLNKNR